MVQIFSQYIPIKTILLSLVETLLVACAIVCGAKLRFWNNPVEFQAYTEMPGFAFQLLPVVSVFQIAFHYGNLYDFTGMRGRLEVILRVGQSIGAASLVLGIMYLLFPSLLIGRGVFMISVGLIPVFVLGNRIILDRTWRFAAPPENVLVFGTRELGIIVAKELRHREDLNLVVVGFVHAESTTVHPGQIAGSPVLGNATELERIVREHRVSRIIVALEDRRGTLPVRELVKLRVEGIRVEDAHSTMASLTGRVWLETIRPSWFVFSEGFHRSRSTLVLKRISDFALSFLFLIFLAPVLVLLAIAIRLDSKGPVLYRQERVGLKGKVFEVLKFRSMCADAEAANGAQWASANDSRVTRVGRFIRKCRLDEIPQIVNILRGDMSFVGPRPERPVFVEELRRTISYYDERHSVRPGLTGWAQVSYAYGASIEDAFRKLEYDLFYLKNLSVLFDAAILIKTIRIVVMGHGSR